MMTPDDVEHLRQVELVKRAATRGLLTLDEAVELVRYIHNPDPQCPITVRFYLTKLDHDDIEYLFNLVGPIAKRSALLGEWLRNVIDDELTRREAVDSDSPREPMQPNCNEFLKWSDAEVAAALKAVVVVGRGTMPLLVGEFLDELENIVVALAMRRLIGRQAI